ncbi:hypothetical protein IWZ03DRAFT_384011 [Phyllosticta citriasiana]|uniref:Secreted protein n=1 Tax=Phyllosticta citriasiana TaxID=595635 RepID=A0ABR1KIF7_9PEZI
MPGWSAGRAARSLLACLPVCLSVRPASRWRADNLSYLGIPFPLRHANLAQAALSVETKDECLMPAIQVSVTAIFKKRKGRAGEKQ